MKTLPLTTQQRITLKHTTSLYQGFEHWSHAEHLHHKCFKQLHSDVFSQSLLFFGLRLHHGSRFCHGIEMLPRETKQ